jgi:3-dehydroquinate synthase
MSRLPSFLHIGKVAGLLDSILQEHTFRRLICLVDENTEKHCLPRIKEILPTNALILRIESGEVNKSLNQCEKIWGQMMDEHIDRNALMINLGGGVITDMGAFCAATYKRGISFIQIPTSLLSMADGSIGNKTGINFGGAKNMLGSFSSPEAVIIDPDFLATLDERQLWNGFAEMIKHGLLMNEETFLDCLEVQDRSQMAALIRGSLAFKWQIVEQDPNEQNRRKVLNIGHTVGHALEALAGGKLLHGEAVLHGLSIEMMLAEEVLGLSDRYRNALDNFIQRYYPSLPDGISCEEAIELMKKDKKNSEAQIRFCLLEAPGNAHIDIEIAVEQLNSVLVSYGLS